MARAIPLRALVHTGESTKHRSLFAGAQINGQGIRILALCVVERPTLFGLF